MKHIKTFEGFLTESRQPMGPNAKKFTKECDSYRTVDEFQGKLPAEVTDFIKSERISNEDAAVVYSQEVGGKEELLSAAKSSGINYKEFEDKFDMGIVFSLKQ